MRFIILCAARTGSTMLGQLLRSHPEIQFRGELLAAPKGRLARQLRIGDEAEARMIELRAMDPGRFLAENVYSTPIAGFKIKYEELSRRLFSDALDWLVAEQSIKVIHLLRRNRLKRFVSQRTVKEHGSYQFKDEAPEPPRFSLSIEECIRDFEKQERREAQFRDLFSEHPTLEVVYEDLQLDQIQRWLGVEPVALRTPTVKINPDKISEMITNYTELEESLRDTRYGAFFDQ